MELPDGCLVLQSRLVAFHYVSGAHDDVNLAKIFVAILKDLGVTGRVRILHYKLVSINNYLYQTARNGHSR
jgi:hypothetical protein